MFHSIRGIVLLLVCLTLTCLSCQENAAHKKYSFVFRTHDEKLYIWQTDAIDTGSIDPIKNGVWLNGPSRIWYYLLVKNGLYYYVDSKTEYFVKSKIENGRFVHLDSIPLPDFSYPDNAVFSSEDTIFLVNHSVGVKPKKFATVNVKNMTAQVAALPLPAPKKPFDNMSVGFEMWRGSNLWLGYTYHYANRNMGYGSSDTVYVARMKYPEMTLENIDKDPRSTYPEMSIRRRKILLKMKRVIFTSSHAQALSGAPTLSSQRRFTGSNRTNCQSTALIFSTFRLLRFKITLTDYGILAITKH